MTILVIGLFWLLCGWLLVRCGIVQAMAAAIALGPLGSFAVVPTHLAGGLTILPSSMLTLIAAGLFLAHPLGWAFVMSTAFSVKRLGLVTALWGVAALSAVVFPRVFAGMVEIVPMRGDLDGVAGGWPMLSPSLQNISQLGYFSISVASILVMAFLFQVPRYQQIMLKGLFVAGLLTVVTGMLDHASQHINVGFILDPFRTASYSLLVEHGVLGMKRVVGLMPEASAYGPMAVTHGVLLFLWKDAFEHRRLRHYSAVLVPLLFVFGFLSASSMAYLTIGASVAVLGARSVLRMLRRRPAARAARLPWRVAAAMTLAGILLLYNLIPTPFAPIGGLVERMVFEKTGSSSFDERMSWNAVSLAALVDTYGVGVGIGGTRTSSLPVAFLASFGVLGTLLLIGLIARVLLSRKLHRHPADRILCDGSAWALVPLLSSNLLTATTPQLGWLAVVIAVQAAFGVARCAAAPRPAVNGVGAPRVGGRRRAHAATC